MSNNNTGFEQEDTELEFEHHSEYEERINKELFKIEAELRNEPY